MNDDDCQTLNGINLSDQIGETFDLESILINFIKTNKNFNKEDLRKMYQDWWNNGKLIILPIQSVKYI